MTPLWIELTHPSGRGVPVNASAIAWLDVSAGGGAMIGFGGSHNLTVLEDVAGVRAAIDAAAPVLEALEAVEFPLPACGLSELHKQWLSEQAERERRGVESPLPPKGKPARS